MTIPVVSRQQMIDALRRFDSEERDADEWRTWQSNGNFEHGLQFEDRLYPVKEVINPRFSTYEFASGRLKSCLWRACRRLMTSLTGYSRSSNWSPCSKFPFDCQVRHSSASRSSLSNRRSASNHLLARDNGNRHLWLTPRNRQVMPWAESRFSGAAMGFEARWSESGRGSARTRARRRL